MIKKESVVKFEKQLLDLGLRHWDGNGILLIPATLFPAVPDGTILTSISGNGRTKVKGKDNIDQDTRGGGLLAFGIMPNQYEEMCKHMVFGKLVI